MTDASSNRVCGHRSGGYACFLDSGHPGRHMSKGGVIWDAIPTRATVCERCGSGLLDGKHIASYPPCNGEDARCSCWADGFAGFNADPNCPAHATRNSAADERRRIRGDIENLVHTGNYYDQWDGEKIVVLALRDVMRVIGDV